MRTHQPTAGPSIAKRTGTIRIKGAGWCRHLLALWTVSLFGQGLLAQYACAWDFPFDPGFEETAYDAGLNFWWDGYDGNPDARSQDPAHPDYTPTVFYHHPITHSGTWVAWFGGWQNGLEEWQYAWQNVVLPSGGPRYLNYWLYVGEAPDRPSLLQVEVRTADGMSTCLTSQDPSTLPQDTDYVQQSLDISSCANGGQGDVIFTFHYSGGGARDGYILLEDVTIDPTPDSSWP